MFALLVFHREHGFCNLFCLHDHILRHPFVGFTHLQDHRVANVEGLGRINAYDGKVVGALTPHRFVFKRFEDGLDTRQIKSFVSLGCWSRVYTRHDALRSARVAVGSLQHGL